MAIPKISDLFNLDNFYHRHLFEQALWPWDVFNQLKEFCKQIKGNLIPGQWPEGVFFEQIESIYIEEGCLIESGAYIRGPCHLGKGTHIRHGAYLRGNVVTGSRCVIGHTTEAKNALLLNGAKAAHFAYIGDSILGNDVNLGAGVKCANFKLKGDEIFVKVDGRRIATGKNKLGAIIGDGCQIGCNAVINPGTIIGPHSEWMPCINQGGVFASKSVIKSP